MALMSDNVAHALAELRAHRQKLDEAIRHLEGLQSRDYTRLSSAGREAISAAAKRRWERHRAAKAAAGVAGA